MTHFCVVYSINVVAECELMLPFFMCECTTDLLVHQVLMLGVLMLIIVVFNLALNKLL